MNIIFPFGGMAGDCVETLEGEEGQPVGAGGELDHEGSGVCLFLPAQQPILACNRHLVKI